MLTQREFFLKHNAQTSDAPLLLQIERAQGIYLYDDTGKRYIDLISGIGVSNVGHCHPKILEAINRQAQRYMHLMVYGEYVVSPQVELAEMLCGMMGGTEHSAYFVNSGAEAAEGAMKLAKRHTGRGKIIACYNAYHGSTQGALSLMGNSEYTQGYRPLLPGVEFITYGDVNSLMAIDNNTACVMVETVQGEAGVKYADKAYFKKLRQRCDETGTLLVLDEIQCGLGRTGKPFTYMHYEIKPDILLLGKALGGGLPLAAFIADKHIMDSLSTNPALGHITTFGGNPVCCAAGKAALEVVMDDGLVEKVQEKSDRILTALNHRGIKDKRAAGLLIAIEFDNFTINKKIIDSCIENGVITDWFLHNPNSLRIAPPLNITDSQIDEACDVINAAIKLHLN